MEKLNLKTPVFKLQRNLAVQIEENKNGSETLKVYGVDTQGGPYDLFKSTLIDGKQSGFAKLSEGQMKDNVSYSIGLNFQGHYSEPSMNLNIPRQLIKQNNNKIVIKMTYDPSKKNS